MKKFGDFIKGQDWYGEPVVLHYGGENTFKTWWGAFLTIGQAVLILVIAVQGVIGLLSYDEPSITQVSASNGENYDIVRGPEDQRIALQGWMSGEAANRVFAAEGLDLTALRQQARSAAFRPITMKARFTAELPVTVERIESANVLAKIPGKVKPDETVQFAAHWDAYGEGPPDAQNRTIRPGANDDALGVAGVMELARLFKAGPAPDRTLVFALWTAEERGLLGSEWYATHPTAPLEKTVANLTLDILQTAGEAKDVILVGAGQSSLEELLTEAARAQNRVVTPEEASERGLFYRADHFSVVRRGVPALQLMALGGASDMRVGGRTAGQKWLDAYMACYHKTCDAWAPDWSFTGAAQDVDLFYAMGKKLSKVGVWPEWRPASEFRAIRAKSADQRQ